MHSDNDDNERKSKPLKATLIRASKDASPHKTHRERFEPRGQRDSRPSQDNREPRENRDYRSNRENRENREVYSDKPKVRDWNDEHIISGFNAVMAVLHRRPGAVVRLFFTDELAPRFGFACKQLAADKKIYRTVTPDELEKLAKTPHHEGVVAITQGRVVMEPSQEVVDAWNAEGALVLVFDQVRNSHNMGAMVRTAAFLGVREILLDRSAFSALNSASAARVAEGGLEEVRLWQVDSIEQFLTRYKSALWIVGTDQNAKVPIGELAQSERRKQGACVLVMGSEEEGLSPEIRAIADTLALIPGSGLVESLNVVQAAAICLYLMAPKPVESVKKKLLVRRSSKP